jgi:hypothetical protein
MLSDMEYTYVGDNAKKRRLVDDSNEQTVILKTGFLANSGLWLILDVSNFYISKFSQPCIICNCWVLISSPDKQLINEPSRHNTSSKLLTQLVTRTRFNQ